MKPRPTSLERLEGIASALEAGEPVSDEHRLWLASVLREVVRVECESGPEKKQGPYRRALRLGQESSDAQRVTEIQSARAERGLQPLFPMQLSELLNIEPDSARKSTQRWRKRFEANREFVELLIKDAVAGGERTRGVISQESGPAELLRGWVGDLREAQEDVRPELIRATARKVAAIWTATERPGNGFWELRYQIKPESH